MKIYIAWGLAVCTCLCSQPASALDLPLPGLDAPVSLSGFATIGAAISDQSYNYQRFVNNEGTLKRDSLLGVQMDAKLNNEFGITLQGKLAPSLNSDKEIDASLSWAFLSWRPTNEWLIRLGRLRVPLYMNSENMDVGTTFDFARLPVEVYTTSQTIDGDGLFVSKAWYMDESEVTLAGYGGTTTTDYRYFRRDDAPPLYSSGSYFVPVRISAYGMALTLQRGDNIFRVGAHDTYTRITDDQPLPVTFPHVSIMPGLGYYQTSNDLPGPGVSHTKNIHTLVYTLGADTEVGGGFRMAGEFVYRDVRRVSTGPDSMAGYIAVLRPTGAWTPYFSVAHIESMSGTRNLYNRVNSNRVPNYDATAALINASQRAGADGIMAYDQTTLALGTSYLVTPTSKVKAEWARTETGDMSFFIDAPPGGESGGKVINVFSLSYNVVF